LHQLGLAAHLYHDTLGTLPRAKVCPAPWLGGQDCNCNDPLAYQSYTGPNEFWWAPFDNRPGTTATQALPDYVPQGLLYPYVEGNVKTFRCPEGFDMIPGSPTQGQTYQVSYAMNGVTGGPGGFSLPQISNGNGTAQVLLIWDHANLPVCYEQQGTVRYPIPLTAPDVEHHYPGRHIGSLNVLFCDGHAACVIRGDLQTSLFYAN
jgi:prepilin-type processing-associated H-X9-DG protein